MATLRYWIQWEGPGGPGFANGGVISSYLGGAVGTPQTRVYPIADAPPAFVNFPKTLGVSTPLTAGDYYVDFKDDSVANQRLARVKALVYSSSCYQDGGFDNPTRQIIRYETYIEIINGDSAISGSGTNEVSVDGGLTWKTLTMSTGWYRAVFTNDELAALGLGDTIPTVQIKRTYQTYVKSVASIDASAYPGTVGFAVLTVPSGASPYIVGDSIKLIGLPSYGTTAVVLAIPPGPNEIVISVPFVGDESGGSISKEGSCVADIAQDFFIGEASVAPFTASGTSTNETSAAADDGTITLAVSGGSGSFSFLWSDGSTSENRTGLPAGDYSVTITDDVTAQEMDLDFTITEPAPEPIPAGTYFDIPKMQSLRFVKEATVDNCTVLQTFDNTLFCKMKWPSYYCHQYYERVCKCDPLPIQIWSNYPVNSLMVKDLLTGADVADMSASIVLKQQLIGLTSSFGVYFTNASVDETAGTSRMYFVSGTIPIPMLPGTVFNITGNAEGFNGSYSAIAIKNDILQSIQYVLISKVYSGAGPTSSGTAVFQSNTTNFNIYEGVLDFTTVPPGRYYIEARGTNPDASFQKMATEPFDLKFEHPKTNLIEWTNFDNAFGVAFSTGIRHRMRIDSHLVDPDTGHADENYRESNGSPLKLVGRPQRRFKMRHYQIPFYLCERLAIAWSCDEVKVNGVQYESDENTASPGGKFLHPFYNVDIVIEQPQWFEEYNGDDLGSVGASGFILTQYGYIRRT